MGAEEARTMVVYRSCDRYDFNVSEELVFKSRLMKDLYLEHKKNEPEKKKHIYFIPGITRNNLAMVVNYCNNLIPSRELFSYGIVTHLNLIQAAHYLKIQRLMDYSCNILVIKNRKIRKIIHESLCLDEVKFLSKNQQLSEDDSSLKIDILLRSRQKDTFINDSDFLDVYFSPFVLSHLHFFQRGQNTFIDHLLNIMEFKDLAQLLEAIRSFEEFIRGDPRLAYRINAQVVRYLIKILHRTEYNPDSRLDIQRPVLSILSHARFDICGVVIAKELLPCLVGFVSDPNNGLAISAVIALTRIAYTFPDRIKVIVHMGALEAAHKALNNHLEVYWSMEHLAKFLATVCRGYSFSSNDNLPSDEVGKILTILDSVCQKWCYAYRMVHTVTCYALLYLSYERGVAFEEEVWNRLKQRLVDYISIVNDPGRSCSVGTRKKVVRKINHDQMLAGSALGVVGHIMRWGNQDQMQSLSEVPQFWCCLRNMLSSKLRKFQKEACQIISNIAARRKTLIKDVIEANIEEYLCGLLEKGGSDVKMEAAWAIFNIICGEEHLCSILDVELRDAFIKFYMTCGPIVYDHIDKYPG